MDNKRDKSTQKKANCEFMQKDLLSGIFGLESSKLRARKGGGTAADQEELV